MCSAQWTAPWMWVPRYSACGQCMGFLLYSWPIPQSNHQPQSWPMSASSCWQVLHNAQTGRFAVGSADILCKQSRDVEDSGTVLHPVHSWRAEAHPDLFHCQRVCVTFRGNAARPVAPAWSLRILDSTVAACLRSMYRYHLLGSWKATQWFTTSSEISASAAIAPVSKLPTWHDSWPLQPTAQSIQHTWHMHTPLCRLIAGQVCTISFYYIFRQWIGPWFHCSYVILHRGFSGPVGLSKWGLLCRSGIGMSLRYKGNCNDMPPGWHRSDAQARSIHSFIHSFKHSFNRFKGRWGQPWPFDH